jgi:hypothetical protein
MEADLVRREADDPLGIPLDSEERRVCGRILLEGVAADVTGADSLGLKDPLCVLGETVFLLTRFGSRAALGGFSRGEYRLGLPIWRDLARDAERQGPFYRTETGWRTSGSDVM